MLVQMREWCYWAISISAQQTGRRRPRGYSTVSARIVALQPRRSWAAGLLVAVQKSFDATCTFSVARDARHHSEALETMAICRATSDYSAVGAAPKGAPAVLRASEAENS